MLSLSNIANAINGKVPGNKVVAPGPEAASHKVKWKRRRHTITVYINGEDIGVNCHHPDQDPIEAKNWVRAQAGLPAWKPWPKKPKGPKADHISFKTRNMFFGETLRVHRRRPIQQLGLLINDLRPIDEPTKTWARWYGSELGFAPVVVEQAISNFKHRTYTADERARILGVTYAERQLLGLRRTGSIDLDKAGRERARRDRGNAAKREKTAAAGAVRASEEAREREVLISELQELLASSTTPEVSHSGGVNRCIPSLEVDNSNRIDSDSQENHVWNRPKILESSKINEIDRKNRRHRTKL